MKTFLLLPLSTGYFLLFCFSFPLFNFNPAFLVLHTELCMGLLACPTDLFTVSEPQNQEMDEYHVVQERRATHSEAPKLWKDRSGGFLSRGSTTI